MIDIGFKEIGKFSFEIDSDKMLIGQTFLIEISLFGEKFNVLVKRDSKIRHEGRMGVLEGRLISGYKIKFTYEFQSEFTHGKDIINLKVNNILVQEIPINFYKNIGIVKHSQRGEFIQLAIDGTATGLQVDGESIGYYKRGDITFATYPQKDDAEIIYKIDGKLYVANIETPDNKLGDEGSTMLMTSHNFTASLFTGLKPNKEYRFVNDGKFYQLKERYQNRSQLQSATRLNSIDGKVLITPTKKVNNYVVMRNERFHPLTIITR